MINSFQTCEAYMYIDWKTCVPVRCGLACLYCDTACYCSRLNITSGWLLKFVSENGIERNEATVEDETRTRKRCKLEQEIRTGSFEKRKTPHRNKTRKGEDEGYIYVMQDKPDRFKVGCSKRPESRLRQLQTGNVDLRLVHKKYVSSHMQRRESQVHADVYNKYRFYHPEISSREWYVGCTLDYLRGIIERHAS